MAGPRRSNGHNGGKRELPPSWMSGWFDPELDELFSGQPELKRTATLLRAAEAPAQASDELLKPAPATSSEPSQLLRAHIPD